MAPRRPRGSDRQARHTRSPQRPPRRHRGLPVPLPDLVSGRGTRKPYDPALARAAATGERWTPLATGYLARRFNEHFGQGAASYVEVRDGFASDEFDAWLAFFDEWDKREDERKEAAAQEAAMKAAAAALRG
jgi:hypothetical protein